jgi:hypothetical protein
MQFSNAMEEVSSFAQSRACLSLPPSSSNSHAKTSVHLVNIIVPVQNVPPHRRASKRRCRKKGSCLCTLLAILHLIAKAYQWWIERVIVSSFRIKNLCSSPIK